MGRLFLYRNTEVNELELRFVPSGKEEDVEEGVIVHPLGVNWNQVNFAELHPYFVEQIYASAAGVNNLSRLDDKAVSTAMYIALIKWLKVQKNS